jgi:hypothetical protein
MQIEKPFTMIFLSLFLAGIAGCGGGGSSGGSNTDSSTDGTGDGNTDGNDAGGGAANGQFSGVFVDAPVSGLEYEIDGDRFLTDENGTFRFETGEELSFYVGDIFLGSASAAAVLTPLDLVPDALDETEDQVINLLRFLQTLDNDADLSNGIQIIENVRVDARGESLDFGVPVGNFAGASSLLVNELTSATTSGSRQLVSEASALSHFRDSLQEISSIDSVTPVEGTVITEAEANQLFLDGGSGLWRADFTADETFEYDTGPGSRVSIERMSRFRSMILVREDPQEVDFCSVFIEPAPLNIDFLESFGGTSHSCSEESERFKRTSSGGLGYEYFCGDQIVTAGTLEKISNATAFDQGTLSINSVDLPSNINSADGVCGSITSYASRTTTLEPVPDAGSPAPGIRPEWTVIMGGPYENGWMEVFLNFTGDQIAGTYPHVGDKVEDYTQPHAAFAFFPDAGDEIPLVANGTVTVTGVSLYSVNVNYDLVTETGTELTGSFSLNLR